MNLDYKPKNLQDKLNRLNNSIDCWQRKDTKDKVVILEFEKSKGNPKELFAIGVQEGRVIHIKTDFHSFDVINVFLEGFFIGIKNKYDINTY